MFLTFEGGEGCGKTTQITRLIDFLQSKGIEVVRTREPGGSEGGEIIRELLVKGDVNRWDNITEALLLFAGRRDHVERLIKPALAEGKWVISDRFADSSYAYQLYGYKNENIDKVGLDTLYDFTLKDFKTDLTLILDLPVEVGIERKKLQGDEFARFERKGTEFHNNLRQGYLKIAQENPDRCKVIDATKSLDEVFDAIIEQIEPWLK